jgi:hypothetical protein
MGQILIAAVSAFFVALLVSLAFKSKNPWGVFWLFFVIIFLGAWAGSIWIKPFGPMFWEINFLPTFVTAILIAIIVAAATSSNNTVAHNLRETGTTTDESTSGIAIGAFAWILMFFFIIIIIIGHLL